MTSEAPADRDHEPMRESAQCWSINPDRPRSRCILDKGHKARFHRSYLTKWQEPKGA
jgi:hypothetical protein